MDQYEIVTYLAELPDDVFTEYVGADPDGFRTYGHNSVEEQKALETLRKGGFDRVDGDVINPDGEQVSFEIVTLGAGTWILNAETAAETLSDFGMDVTVRTVDSATFGQISNTDAWDMKVSSWGIGGSGWFHPYNFFLGAYRPWRARNNGWEYPTREVPYPVGNPEGAVESVDVSEKLAALATASSDKEQRDLSTEIAWIYNQDVLRIPINFTIIRSYITTDDWEYSNDISDLRSNLHSTLMRRGKVRKK
jgi:peptide/nickel transport system substrate-binding protein